MAFIVGVVLAGAGLTLMQRLSGASAVDSFEFESGPPPATVFPFQNFGFAVAPDGSQLVMVASAENRLALWVRPLASAEFRRLRGTEGANTPFWSPDSRQIAFFAGGKLKTVGLSGEAPSEVCDAAWGEAGVGGAWNREGVILLGSWAGPIRRVPVTGGVPSGASVRTRGETSHRWPSFLPDGRHFLFLAQGPGGSQLRLGSLASADSTPIGSIRSNAIYAAGHLLFVRGRLMAQRFDLRSRQLVGEPFPLNDGMRLMRGLGAFSASDTGLLGYSAGWPRSETRLTGSIAAALRYRPSARRIRTSISP